MFTVKILYWMMPHAPEGAPQYTDPAMLMESETLALADRVDIVQINSLERHVLLDGEVVTDLRWLLNLDKMTPGIPEPVRLIVENENGKTVRMWTSPLFEDPDNQTR